MEKDSICIFLRHETLAIVGTELSIRDPPKSRQYQHCKTMWEYL